MNKKTKNILGIAGVASTLIGIMIAVPSFLQVNYPIATGSAILIVTGLVLLAISFGD